MDALNCNKRSSIPLWFQNGALSGTVCLRGSGFEVNGDFGSSRIWRNGFAWITRPTRRCWS